VGGVDLVLLYQLQLVLGMVLRLKRRCGVRAVARRRGIGVLVVDDVAVKCDRRPVVLAWCHGLLIRRCV
jgi:hypothetical protein